MNALKRKPTVFISSTIYDFSDLRGALKYYLEELGYVVNMSEFNDFQRDLDENSYSACLETVGNSDYFILLIGSRVGGRYPGESRTSITQMEYRTAYERAKSGRTRILAFVRSDIWSIKEDRKELEKFLASEFVVTGEMTGDSADKIASHASKFATDANQIFSFIDEVCRIEEMRGAIKGGAELPPANWVHRFDTFRDVVDALRTHLDMSSSLGRKILVENLKSELLSNLAVMHIKTVSGDVWSRTRFTEPFRTHYKLTFQGNVRTRCRYVLWLIMGSAQLTLPTPSLRDRALLRCIDAGVFRSFDHSIGDVSPTPAHILLVELKLATDRYLACNISGEFMMLINKYGVRAKQAEVNDEAEMIVKCDDFAATVNAANRLDDVFVMTELLYRHLNEENVDLVSFPRKPLSPYADQEEMLIAEAVSVDEVQAQLAGR